MTMPGSISFLGLALLTAIVPYFVVRRSHRTYLVADASFWALALVLYFLWPRLGLGVDARLLFGLFFAGRLGFFSIYLSMGRSADLFRWTTLAAALFAGSVYLVLIPHVLQWPIDGDEPFYVLITESIVADQDLDLANQFRHLDQSVTRRPDLRPQSGDPRGPNGARYSRHEPFLPLLLVPGWIAGGLAGTVCTIALFGALLVWSSMRLLEDSGLGKRTIVMAYPLIAFGPPVLFYSTRIWPEAPAAFFFSEALRATIHRRWIRMIVFLGCLSLLKLRFIPVAVVMVLIVFIRNGGRRRALMAAALLTVLAVPLVVVWFATGDPLSVHTIREIAPHPPGDYGRGLVGLLLDAQGGLLFQAPFWFLGALAALRWRELPESYRTGALASLLYLVLLIPRAEWHGGWSPPLRYLVVFAPVFALGGAWVLERSQRSLIAILAVWTGAIVVHGVSYPWRLFHIANGESVLGEWLSTMYRSDFSRLFPSVIRLNQAAYVWSIAIAIGVIAYLLVRRLHIVLPESGLLLPCALTVVIAAGSYLGTRAGTTVHFEDSHVSRTGGELYPQVWTVARFLYSGGWVMGEGDSAEFLFKGGRARLRYRSENGASIRIDGRETRLPATGASFSDAAVDLEDREGRHMLVCEEGEVIADRLSHE